MGASTPKDSSWTKGRLAGNFCCFSPEPPEALFITDATGARTSEKEEVTMRGLFATAVFCLAAYAAQGQALPTAQNEKPKDSQADCPMPDVLDAHREGLRQRRLCDSDAC